MLKIYRAIINNPSTLQPLHEIHGKTCIAIDNGDKWIDIYFTDGPMHSMRAPKLHVTEVKTSSAG